MTKEKAVELIIDKLYPFITNPLDRELVSRRILNALLLAGMQPPTATFKDPGHFPGDQFEYQANEWEYED